MGPEKVYKNDVKGSEAYKKILSIYFEKSSIVYYK